MLASKHGRCRGGDFVRWATSAAAILVVLAMPPCARALAAHERPDDGAMEAQPPTFVEDVWQSLRSRCGGCHHAAAGAGRSGFVLSDEVRADYDATLRFVDLDAPVQSPLLRKGRGETTHLGGRALEAGGPTDRLIVRWISGGVRFCRPRHRAPAPIASCPSGRQRIAPGPRRERSERVSRAFNVIQGAHDTTHQPRL